MAGRTPRGGAKRLVIRIEDITDDERAIARQTNNGWRIKHYVYGKVSRDSSRLSRLEDVTIFSTHVPSGFDQVQAKRG